MKYVEAEPLLLKSYEVLQAAFGPQDKRTRQAVTRIVRLYEAWGKSEESAKYRSLVPNTGSSPGHESATAERVEDAANE